MYFKANTIMWFQKGTSTSQICSSSTFLLRGNSLLKFCLNCSYDLNGKPKGFYFTTAQTHHET